MSFNDPTSDMLATMKNGCNAKLYEVSVVSSNLNKNVLQVLQQEGYIEGFEEVEVRKGVKKIVIRLKYFNGLPVIKRLKRASKPGLRNYSAIKDLQQSYNGLGVKVLSTSKGVLPDYKARELNVGGEVVCEVF
jgi:small subunit ribosomal protein S8